MIKVRLKTAPAALFGGIMLVALLVFFPMRLVLGWTGLDEAGFAARAASGSVWNGRLLDARFGNVALGDLDARLSPLALLLGRATIAFEGRGVRPVSGAASISRHMVGMDHVTGTLPAGGVFAPVPVTALDLEDVSVRFAGEICDKAEGRVTAKLAGEVEGVVLPGSVVGTARCDGGALLLPLKSQPGTESIALRITGSGRYTAVLTLAQPDAAAAERLALAGFARGPQGYWLSIEGRF